MPIEKIELLALSRKLLDNSDEVSYRASASRSYYFIYHSIHEHALNKLEGLQNFSNKSMGSHERLIIFLRKHAKNNKEGSRKNMELARLLKQAKEKRTKADYRLSQKFTSYEARANLRTAIQVENLLGN